jgi:hypothetical protein
LAFSGLPTKAAIRLASKLSIWRTPRVAIEVNFGQGIVYIQRRWCDSELPFKLISESEDGFEQTESPWPSELVIRRFLGPPGCQTRAGAGSSCGFTS